MEFRHIVKQLVPASMRPAAREAWIWTKDFSEGVLGLRNPMVPPAWKNFVGHGDFIELGNHIVSLLQKYGDLKANDRVLDIGCGIGRVAVPLTQVLSNAGSYEGLDIVKSGIQWCTERITPRHPNFKFQLANLYNSYYNPEGKVTAEKYVLPYQDEEFDLVFLTSVFTHMMPNEVQQYLREIARVLKPGGRCFATFFVMNAETREFLQGTNASQQFPVSRDGYYLKEANKPEAAIAFEEEDVRGFYARTALRIRGGIHWGSWCGRPPLTTYQDLIVADKA